LHKKLSCLAVLGLLIAMPLHAPAAEDQGQIAAFKTAIRAKYDLKEAAFKAHDPLPIVNKFYSEDAVSVGPGPGMTRGRAALLEEYKQHMTATVRIESVHTHLNGNNGLDWANFYITPDNRNEKPFSFQILFLWEKRKGEWVCIGDYFIRGKFDAQDEGKDKK
jgi:ketosteroid isomerase-like protein